MINIFLDDVRPCPDGFLVSRNVRHCLSLLKEHQGNIDILSLDHDMGRDSSGFWLVRQMVALGIYANRIYIHSANPFGREKIFNYLYEAINTGNLPRHVKLYNHAM